MEDISPALLKECQEEFRKRTSDSARINAIIKRVRAGNATMKDASAYASEIGKILGKILGKKITFDILPDGTLYWNIANAVVKPMIEQNHDLVNIMSEDCRTIVQKKGRTGLKTVSPGIDEERVKGIMESICEVGIDSSSLRFRLEEEPRNITESFYTEFIRGNCEVDSSAGMKTKVIRTADDCCEWCQSLAGVYDYDDVRDKGNEVWQRHVNCNCEITFVSEKQTRTFTRMRGK